MARPKVKADHRADTRGGRFAGIPLAVIESVAWRHLGLPARAILVELVSAFNGYNNGNIVMSFRGGSVCLHRLAAWISGLPLVDHAAARSGCAKYIWSGVRPPSAECGLTAL